MKPVKIPRMEKEEYDALIERGFLCRIAFRGDKHPYVAPFLYVFDGKHMYFLPTRYGRKMEHFRSDPHVTVEVEEYEPDMSQYSFVTLAGKLETVDDPERATEIRSSFVDLLKDRHLSGKVMRALGHSPADPPEVLTETERTLVWKLVDVERITGLKSG